MGCEVQCTQTSPAQRTSEPHHENCESSQLPDEGRHHPQTSPAHPTLPQHSTAQHGASPREQPARAAQVRSAHKPAQHQAVEREFGQVAKHLEEIHL